MTSIAGNIPIAHRGALDALEAQRAAYQRYARLVEQQRQTLGDGDADRAAAFAAVAASENDALEEGARGLAPLVERVRAEGGEAVRAEVERRVEALMREAHAAELAVRNLATQLEAWRDVYGRQLAELGATPGTDASGEDGAAVGQTGDVRAPTGGYGPRGVGARRTTGAVPSLIDRRG
jgi:hypothetical protein